MVSQFNPSGSLYGGENYFASVLWDQGCLGLVIKGEANLFINVTHLNHLLHHRSYLFPHLFISRRTKDWPIVFEKKWPLKNFKYSLRASSPWPSRGGAGKERRASNYVSGIWISASKTSMRNTDWRRWHKHIRAFFLFALIGNLIAQPTRGATRGWNSHSRDVVASSPSFSCPAVKVPWRTCSQAIWNRPFSGCPKPLF